MNVWHRRSGLTILNAGRASFALLIAAAGAWGTLALLIAAPPVHLPRYLAAVAVSLASIAAVAALWRVPWRLGALGAYLVVLLALAWWWQNLEPSNERSWQEDVAIMPSASIDGDEVVVRNIRNFEYRSETDYTPAWYDKRFLLSNLTSVDLIAAHWMGPAIAHIFLSFGFLNGDRLAISIETRKELGEEYSAIKGFFRNYELYYVLADERDVIRLRTNFRRDPPEDVYLYQLQGSDESAKRVFLEFMHKINGLRIKPEFYNTLTTNCTTNLWIHSRVNPDHLPMNWKILFSGYLPEYLYEHGWIKTHIPFAELRQQARINARAQGADGKADFSERIRAHPSMQEYRAPDAAPAQPKRKIP